MDPSLKVLVIDAATGFYRMERYKVGEFFGPVDLGLALAAKYQSLNIGVGLLSGSIFPGSNRLIFSGFSPCWGSFYVSSMGGAGLVFDNLGVNMLAIIRRASPPSILCINRLHGEEVDLTLVPIDLNQVWKQGRGGVYGMMDHALAVLGSRFQAEPRILAVGPAAQATDFGAIASAPVHDKNKVTFVDTWAGRGGFGSKMLREHGLAAIIYGGTHIDEDFRDRKVADQWFVDKYQKKLLAKDLEATTKYRFDPKMETGGTFGVNFATLGGRMISFNYRSMYWEEQDRLDLHQRFIVNHYLKQFNEETIKTKNFATCGEPCIAVCKKMHGKYKKDYEPYQTMGPLCGIFDQRAAEEVNHRADMYGFDAISVGGVLAWLLEAVHENLLTPEELDLSGPPVFSPKDFRVETDSRHNADLAISLLDGMIKGEGWLNMAEGARKTARRLARERGKKILDLFVYNANARKGWMVPNQYWTPGVLSPMAIMGKYYMVYGHEFYPPRELGRRNAKRMLAELVLDNLGLCRFHRNWAEDMAPEIVDSLYGLKKEFLDSVAMTASRINSRNAAIFWESERNADFIHTFLKRRREIDHDQSPDLVQWLDRFTRDQGEAALEFWYEIHKGVHESLREF